MNRREVLRWAGIGGVVGLSGCAKQVWERARDMWIPISNLRGVTELDLDAKQTLHWNVDLPRVIEREFFAFLTVSEIDSEASVIDHVGHVDSDQTFPLTDVDVPYFNAPEGSMEVPATGRYRVVASFTRYHPWKDLPFASVPDWTRDDAELSADWRAAWEDIAVQLTVHDVDRALTPDWNGRLDRTPEENIRSQIAWVEGRVTPPEGFQQTDRFDVDPETVWNTNPLVVALHLPAGTTALREQLTRASLSDATRADLWAALDRTFVEGCKTIAVTGPGVALTNGVRHANYDFARFLTAVLGRQYGFGRDDVLERLEEHLVDRVESFADNFRATFRSVDHLGDYVFRVEYDLEGSFSVNFEDAGLPVDRLGLPRRLSTRLVATLVFESRVVVEDAHETLLGGHELDWEASAFELLDI